MILTCRTKEGLNYLDSFSLPSQCFIHMVTRLTARLVSNGFQPIVCKPHLTKCMFSSNIVQGTYIEGFGLTDGEVVERLWAYLRHFARMTKEMQPSHRVDVLTDALYYSNQSIKRLRQSHISFLVDYDVISIARLLASRMEKALKLQQECTWNYTKFSR